MSFQRTRRGVTTWVGWDNYERIWNDPAFGTAWKNTLLFTVLALVLGYAVPFFVAIVLNEFRHAQGYLRVLVYLPVMLPPAAGAVAVQVPLRPERRGHLQLHPHARSDLPHVAVGPVAGHHDALAGDRVHLDEHGRRGADLPGRAAEHPGRAVRGGRDGGRRACCAGSGT